MGWLAFSDHGHDDDPRHGESCVLCEIGGLSFISCAHASSMHEIVDLLISCQFIGIHPLTCRLDSRVGQELICGAKGSTTANIQGE